MPGPLKTEAIVLRSIRYGEADRILHLYTPAHGRLSAIAKGARRARSRFGARLEPFFHVRAVLHEGRSDLLTVTGVDTVSAHAAAARSRRHARRRRPRLRRGDAPVRDLRSPSRGVPPAGQRARAARRRCRPRPHRQRARVPAQAAAGGRDRAAAGRLRGVRRDRAPARLLRRRRRRRLQLLRGGGVRARRGRLPVPGRGAGRAAGRRRRTDPSARCARSSARSARPPSTTPTCGCGRCWPPEPAPSVRPRVSVCSLRVSADAAVRGAVRIGV